jgi:CobQ-like glutamine amidotransferase family enzyme
VKLVVAALFAEHLDLNGDQANLKVLAKRASWYGVELEVIDVQKGQNLPAGVDLIFVGHGSKAAWRDIADDLGRLNEPIRKHLASGGAFMAVASGYEMSVSQGLVAGNNSKQARVSKFEVADLDGRQVLGYVNTESTLPIVQQQAQALLTMLHGPFFAKNPDIADALLRRLVEAKGQTFETVFVTEKAGQSADFIKVMVADAWQLESDLARE